MCNLKDESEAEKEFMLDILIFGLTEKCPFSEDNPTNCPLHEVRNYSTEKRLTLINQLTYQDKLLLFENHKGCLLKKEEIIKKNIEF